MPIYLGSTEIATVGGGTTAAAGGMPQTEIFTTSGTWNVPTSVKSSIDTDGHADIGLLMVGGGSGSTSDSSDDTRGGEVISEVYQLTRNDYDAIEITVNGAVSSGTSINFDDSSETVTTNSLATRNFTLAGVEYTVSSNTTSSITLSSSLSDSISDNDVLRFYEASPKVSVYVGAAGGDSGITKDIGAAPTISQTFSSTINVGNGTTSPNSFSVNNASSIKVDGSGRPYIKSISFSQTTVPHSFSTALSPATPVWGSAGGGTATITSNSITFPVGDAGIMSYFRAVWSKPSGFPNSTYAQFTYSSSTMSISVQRSISGHSTSAYSATVTFDADPSNEPTKKARAGSDSNYLSFPNNPYSGEGLLGFSKNRYDSLTGTSQLPTYYGSPNQGGYVQIFF